MGNRRKLRPGELARLDRNLAEARDLAAHHPDTLAMATVEPLDGEQCSWCDCPLADHQTPGYTCSGCPSAADLAVISYAVPDMPARFPLCSGHWPTFTADTQTVVAAPIAFVARPVYDEEATR